MITQTIENGMLSIRSAKKSEETIEIFFTGDLCPRARTEKLLTDGKGDDILSELMPILSGCDLTVTNLETPLTHADTPILKSGPNLKVDPKCISLLKNAQFDIALLANNHIGDFGTKPVMETIELLSKNKIKTVGAGSNLKDARKPLFVRKKGFKTAFLNYAENEFGGATENKPGASPLDPMENIAEIKAASQKADVTIVVIHGGNERNPIPSPRMKKTYRAFADAGATAVISIHTHCPQGIEVWNGVPIIYSLGNFLFDWPPERAEKNATSFWWTGYNAKLTFTKGAALSVEAIPITFAPDGQKVRLFDEKSKKQFFKYLSKLSDILIDEKESKAYWEAWCAKMGAGLTKDRTFPQLPVKTEEDMKKALVVRNIFTCETHNEVLTTFMRLVEENRVEAAMKYLPKIEKLQKADFDILKKIK